MTLDKYAMGYVLLPDDGGLLTEAYLIKQIPNTELAMYAIPALGDTILPYPGRCRCCPNSWFRVVREAKLEEDINGVPDTKPKKRRGWS